MTKEREILSNVLKLYKNMSYLWNKADKKYYNKNARDEGFQVMLNVYKNIDDTATIKTLKKKIDNLKTNYIREAKKVRESKHTGAGSGDIYVPTIWYYNYFDFLELNTEPCHSVTDTIEDEASINNNSFQDSSSSCAENDTRMSTASLSTSKQNSFKRKKKGAPLKALRDILEKTSGITNAKEEDWELLGRSIGMQLRDVNQRQHVIARKLISDVIYYATLNKLNEESFVAY